MGRVGGQIFLSLNGVRRNAKGQFTYNLGANMREGVLGHDGVHGHKSLPQIPFIEGEITDETALDLRADLLDFEGGVVTLQLNNGKTIVLRDGYYANAGNVQTEEGNIAARFEGQSCDESPA